MKIGNVDAVICVSDYYARLTREKTGWPAAKIVTVPNALDVLQFDRPKLDGARFHLGMTSMVPMRKRLDLALDVLEELRRDDDRYQLFVKSGMPWELWWVWQHQEERVHYFDAFRRVQRSPLLRDAVVFDDGGPGRARLAAQDRVHPVGQRRRVVPHGARRGHGVPRGAGHQALAGRGDDLRQRAGSGKTRRRWPRRSPRCRRPRRGRPPGRTRTRTCWRWDVGTVAETWLRLIRGASPDNGQSYHLSGAQSAG